MVAAFAAGVVVAAAAVAFVGYKYHSAKAALAAVKAELVKIEAEEKSNAVVGRALDVVARLKTLL